MTDKSDDKVGHLNTILARGGGNLNDPIFKSSNARGLPGGGGGMLKFRVDRRINTLLRKGTEQQNKKPTPTIRSQTLFRFVNRVCHHRNYRIYRTLFFKKAV